VNHPGGILRHVEARAFSIRHSPKPRHLASVVITEQSSEAFGKEFLKAEQHHGSINQLSSDMQKHYQELL